MKLSIVCSTYNRADLLDVSLASYARQTLDRSQWEYLLVDDGSTDHTKEVARKWAFKGLPIRYFTAEDVGRPKVPGVWRDGSGCRNAVSLQATGEYLVGTYPEVLIPAYLLEALATNLDTTPPPYWLTTIPYWLPPVPEGYWKTWKATPAEFEALHALPGFYDPSWPSKLETPGAVDYRNNNQETRMDWQSDGVLWAMPMGLWRWLGGFRELDAWGAIDMDFWERRRIADIPTRLPTSPLSPHTSHVLMAYHMHHGDSPRDMEKAFACIKAAGPYTSKDQMRALGGIAGFYHHGPRERALAEGVLEGIDPYAMARYEWASQFVEGKRVVDCPMGTGYGCPVLRSTARAYVGVDHDAESVRWAQSYIVDPKVDLMMVGKMEQIPLPKWTADVLCCFGGLGLLKPKESAYATLEMLRVMKPGGTLLVDGSYHEMLTLAAAVPTLGAQVVSEHYQGAESPEVLPLDTNGPGERLWRLLEIRKDA